MNKLLRAPFPYFGGKSKIALIVWKALGEVNHYIEPFFGSGAVLLARPVYDPEQHVESVCDKDGFVANVWRAIQYQPDETAKWCDWPVNHCDLIARRRVLIENEERLLENLVADDIWCDPKLAGYWIWAASCWIGDGLTRPNAIPYLSDAGKGINSQKPHLSDAWGLGMGVHAKQSNGIYEWMAALSWRLRKVRVVCGDWTRVCGGHWQDRLGTVGIFFDPPYSVQDRAAVYHHDSKSIAQDVNAWCLERGVKQTYGIVLAGYHEEHQNLLKNGWTEMLWKAAGGYSSLGKGETQGKKNCEREALFFSPYCKKSSLFGF